MLEALDRIGRASDRAGEEPVLADRAAAARAAAEELRANLEVPARNEARVEVMQTADGLMRAIWVRIEGLDADRNASLQSVQVLAISAIGLAALSFLLFVGVRQKGFAAEELSDQLEAALTQSEADRAEAERANEAKTQFLATVSHEIRTPMTVILGRAELLRTTTLDVAQTGHLDVIDRAGDQLLQLISDVLDLSRIEAGRLELEPTEFDLDQMLDETIVLFRGAAEGRGLQLRRDGARVGTVRGDARRLRQVLVNLVGNAVKFTGSGGVTVRGERAGPNVVLEVSDTGPGIPAGQEEALFESFTQADSTTSRPHGGAGLGLAICRKLVEAMEGTISARNRDPRGAVFRVEVPLPVVHEPAISEELDVEIDPPEPQGPRVLVVDDNEDTREVVGLLLESLGCRIERAAGGAEAIDRAHAEAFDLIFMDCDMPGIDGLATTSSLRSGDGPSARTPIVGLSGYASHDARERALEAGMDDYVTKPVRIGGLKAALDRWAGATSGVIDL